MKLKLIAKNSEVPNVTSFIWPRTPGSLVVGSVFLNFSVKNGITICLNYTPPEQALVILSD